MRGFKSIFEPYLHSKEPIVTAQPHFNHNPTPTQQKIGWDTVVTKKPPHPPQTQTKRKNKNRAILRKQKLLVYMNKAQKSFQVPP